MNVHEDHVRAVAGNFSNSFFCRGTVEHATKPRRAINPLAKQTTNDRIDLDDGDVSHDMLGGMGSGSWRTTVAPAPEEEVILHCPPRFSSRLRRFVRPLPARRSRGSKPAP